MLVLTWKIGERMVLGGQIVIEVLEVNGTGIRLGIEAPPQVAIWRGELSDRHESASAPRGTARNAQDTAIR
jgi:carbon storage regulator